MSTRDPYAVLLDVLDNSEPGAYWSSATWHDEAVLAQLKSGEIGAAQKRAVAEGFLEPVGRWIDDEWSPNMTRVKHAAGDGRWVVLYQRTAKRVQPVPVDAPGTLVEAVGA